MIATKAGTVLFLCFMAADVVIGYIGGPPHAEYVGGREPLTQTYGVQP